MKLQIENNSSSDFMGNSDLYNEVSSANGSAEVTEMLKQGINAAQNGNRAEARHLLIQATELEPKNENAWLWLASISEYPEELLIFLSNVLNINPTNERALEWEKSTKSLLSKTFVQRGIEATKESQTAFSRQCFLQAIVHDDQNEMAWLWLASISDIIEEKKSYLQKVLNINPDNETALALLRAVKCEMAQVLLRKAQVKALAGEKEAAEQMLGEILNHVPELEDAWMLKSFLTDSFSEKINYFEKVLEINAENEDAISCLTAMREVLKKIEPNPDSDKTEDFDFTEKSIEPEAISVSDLDVSNEKSEALEMPNVSFEETLTDLEISAESYYTTEETADFPTQDYKVSEDSEQEIEIVDETVENSPQPESAVDVFEINEDVSEVSQNEETKMNLAFSDVEKIEASFFEEIQHNVEEAQEQLEEVFAVSEMPSYQEVIEEAETFEEEQKAEEIQYVGEYSELSRADEVKPEENFSSAIEPEAQVFAEEIHHEEQVSFENYDSTPVSNEIYDSTPVSNENYDSTSVSDESFDSMTDESQAEVVPQFDQFEETAEETTEATAEFEESAVMPVQVEEMPKVEMVSCPFCGSENDPQVFVCQTCRAMLTLSDVEMLLAYQDADQTMLKEKIEQMEIENSFEKYDADGLKNLGIGLLNLKSLRKGFEYLQESAQLNTSDVVLSSQINSLAIRLSEIEEQQNIHDSMPKNKTILIVDDSATVRKLISGKLEKCGLEVICAVDGMDALEKINEAIPDLILLDITMPRMDGYQVCKLIRGNEATKDVPVVMISGKDGFFDKVRGRMAGTTGYITKPFGPEALMKTVESYIN
jgi:CheY-like chemotaxis protein